MTEALVPGPKFEPHSMFTLRNKKWYYKGEGNANVVLAVPEDGVVVRIMKNGGDNNAIATVMVKMLKVRLDYCDAVHQLFFDHYIDVPVVMSMSAEELRKIDQHLQQSRPANRAHQSLGWIVGLVAVCPDYTVLPEPPLSTISETVVWCVEIKPKQGWTHEADRSAEGCHGNWCAFCAHQYLKLNRGDITEISRYCPQDLFSGRRDRVERAMHNLFRSPQNNLKVFRNGVPMNVCGGDIAWFGFSDSRQFCAFVADALLGDFQDGTTKCRYEVSATASELFLADDEGTSSRLCDFDAVPMSRHCVLHRILTMQQMQTTGFQKVCSEFDKRICRLAESTAAPQFDHVGRLVSATTGQDTAALSPVDGYLVASTARDCSVFVTFCQMTRVDDRRRYAVCVKVSDLDPKPLSTVHKHRKRNAEVLLACEQYSNRK